MLPKKTPNKTELNLLEAKRMTTHSCFFTAHPALDTVSTFFATEVILSELAVRYLRVSSDK